MASYLTMKISFDSVVRVLESDDTIVDRQMNVDGTFYDFDTQMNLSMSEGSIDFLRDENGLTFMDAVETSGNDEPAVSSVLLEDGFVTMVCSESFSSLFCPSETRIILRRMRGSTSLLRVLKIRQVRRQIIVSRITKQTVRTVSS